MKYTAIVNGKTYDVEIERAGGAGRSIGHTVPSYPTAPVAAPAAAPVVAPVAAPVVAPAPAAPVAATGSGVVSPMPGKVLNVLVKAGDQITAGQLLVMLEAMKMEIEVRADRAGTVSSVPVKVGDTVENGTVLVNL